MIINLSLIGFVIFSALKEKKSVVESDLEGPDEISNYYLSYRKT